MLTNGETVGWDGLRAILVRFAERAGRLNDRGLALVTVCMSTCEGAHAAQMFDRGAPYPCFGIVGPKEKVSWPDALMGFLVFYHLSVYHDEPVPAVVPTMNAVVRAELFEAHTPENVHQLISPGGARVASLLLQAGEDDRVPPTGGP